MQTPIPHPRPLRRESSEASPSGKRRNSHHSAVFGKAGNETVVGISELIRVVGLKSISLAALEPEAAVSAEGRTSLF
mgnify:CR=1 FL=1